MTSESVVSAAKMPPWCSPGATQTRLHSDRSLRGPHQGTQQTSAFKGTSQTWLPEHRTTAPMAGRFLLHPPTRTRAACPRGPASPPLRDAQGQHPHGPSPGRQQAGGGTCVHAHPRPAHSPAPGEDMERKEHGSKAIFKPVKVELSSESPLGTQFNRPSHRQK